MKHLAIGILTFLLVACVAAPVSVPTPPGLPPLNPILPTPKQDSAPPASPTDVSTSTPALGIPNPDGYLWRLVISGLRQPVDIQNAGDGSGRLFLVERGGRIRIFKNGLLLERPLLDISERLSTNGAEQGLLGLAFHPRFAENGYFYVNYTDRDGNTVIARFRAVGDQADAAGEMRLLYVKQPYANHNGGGLAFGPDGYLYVGLGDGGSGGDPLNNAQSLNIFLGKLLRLNVDAPDSPYAIPSDNPFAAGNGLPEIWAYGLRNPWRFSFNRLTGDLYIGDVGQNAYEEIDFLPSGERGGLNFGWNRYEGFHDYGSERLPITNHRPPVFEYTHAEGCSVTGGVTYRGLSLPEWNGIYLFGDFCSGKIWGLLHQIGGADEQFQIALLFLTGFNISTFGLDESGEIYLADYSSGAVYRLERK